MSNGNFVQIIGTLGGDPDLRFTSQGIAVASFSLAWSPRKRTESGEWVDGDTSWYRCTVWRDMAESVASSLTKGMRVIVTGQVTARDWEDKDGNKRTSIEIQVDEVSPSLRWATVQVERTEREKPTSGGSSGGSASGPVPDEEPFVKDAETGEI